MNESYYNSQKAKLMKDFERTGYWFRPYLTERYGQIFADTIIHDARNEYESLIPQIPYIGGSKVHMTSDLLESVVQLAYLRILKAHGKTAEESREILYRGMMKRLAQYPKFLLRILGWLTFTKLYLRNLQRQARESQTCDHRQVAANPAVD